MDGGRIGIGRLSLRWAKSCSLGPDRRFLANSKNNSGPGGRSLAYLIKTVKVHVDQQDLETGRVYWDESR